MKQSLIDVNALFIPEFTELTTINGRRIEAIASEADADTVIAEMGADASFDCSIIVREEVNAAEDDLVKFRGKEYRITHVATDSAGATKRLYLMSKYGGGA